MKGKVVSRLKKYVSCIMAMFLVVVSCNNVWAVDSSGRAVGTIFMDADGFFRYRIIDEENKYVGVAGAIINDDFLGKPLNIPAEIEYNGITYSVTSIQNSAFKSYSRISEVNIPYGVTEIRSEAFEGSSISYVNIPNSVTIIGGSAFADCTNLQNVEIPESVEEIGAQAFSGCSSFTKIIIPEGVKKIDMYAFYDCKLVDTISLPTSIETMETYAFASCGNDVDELSVM